MERWSNLDRAFLYYTKRFSMAIHLEALQTLRTTLEAEQLRAVELLAVGDVVPSATPNEDFRRLAALHSVLSAVRDEIARHGPRMGHGTDPIIPT
jgi:hypothetical protein